MNGPQAQDPIGAFERLVRDHHDAVMRQALAILRDFHRAEDVTQETFLEAVLSLDRLREPAAMGAWLRAIARHRCHRVLRSRDLELLPPEELWQRGMDETAPPESAAMNEARGALAELLRTLQPDLRDAALLFYVRQCSQREAAAFLGVPLSTVNNRLHSARSILKQRMANMPMQTQAHGSPLADFAANVGTIIDVRGPIVDARFDQHTPDIFDALVVADPNGKASEGMKVAQRLDGGIVRCIATGSADALKPGMSVMNSGELGVGLTPWIGVTQVSDQDLARAVETIAQPAPAQQLLSAAEPALLLETGIKPIDLFCPFTQGGTVALLGIQGVGRIVLVEELMHRLAGHPRGVRVVYLVDPNEPDSVRGMLTKEKEYPGDVVGNVQTWWVLSDKAVDPEAADAMALFHAVVYCTPLLGIAGLFPAVDALASRSRLLDERIVGAEHVEIARRVRDAIREMRGLMVDPVLLEHLACRARKKAWERAKEFPQRRMSALPAEQRLLVSRARKLERFLTTPFFVAEPFNHRPGKFVSREQTLHGCRSILDGEFDDVTEDSLAYIGPIEEARTKELAKAFSPAL